MRWLRGHYEIDTDFDRLDLPGIAGFLSTSYWAEGVPVDVVRDACRGSLCFGLYHRKPETRPELQVGFARAVTDRATFAYLADVYVLGEHREQGLSKWLVECVLAHPELQGLRRWMLATRDAHGLYERYGFESLAEPSKFMEIARPGIYGEDPG